MEKKTVFTVVLMVFIISGLLFGSYFYIVNIQNSLWMQSVKEILETTGQGRHAFEIYIEKDQEIMRSIARKISEKSSFEEDEIMKNIDLLGGRTANYIIIDFEHGILYSNRLESKRMLTEEELAYFDSLPESGLNEPYINDYNGHSTLGYYQRFNFADGARGMIRKGQLVSDISREFSLSFYDNRGFSYVINKDGDIMIRSKHMNSNRTFPNMFDVIKMEGNDAEDLKAFSESLTAGKNGIAQFVFDGEDYVFAFSPIKGTNGWYMVSIVPNSVIMTHTNQILQASRMFVLLVGSMLLIVTLFMFFVWHSRRRIIQKEKEIIYRDQLFSILAQNTNDIFLMLNPDTFEVGYLSPNIERVLGIPYSEAKSDLKSLGSAVYGSGAELTYQSLDALRQGESITRECERYHRETGEKLWFVETLYRAAVDNSDRFIVVLSDRTSERQSRIALEEALKIANVANKAKSTFLSNMSHDIRTPMNAIVGLTVLMQRDVGNPERIREYTRKIAASSQHLLGLINDVLDMSKIESGKTTLNISEINIAEIIEELGTIIRPQAKAKQQKFNISVHDVTCEYLLGDKLRINQVLINILSNAVKYTGVGGNIEMTVMQLPQETKNFSKLRFIVKDNGMGMSEEFLETIFQPFTRENTKASGQIQGTGIGMAIAKSLVDLMGGTISVKSKQGEGSVFTIDLEFRIQEQDVDEDFWAKHSITHILVVDNDEDVCESVICRMNGTGVSMKYALDGLSAIEQVKKAHEEGSDFDVVLLDWKMPGMDGLETTKRIREILPKNVPVIILTAYDWSDIENDAIAAGVDGFLPKPFFLSNFRQAIRMVKSVEKTDPVGDSSESALSGMKFLAAEDNELNSEILTELLDMKGAACEIAANGQKALEMFEQSEPGRYDMILMDVQMPIMNGYETTKAIRALCRPDAKTIPIIAMTANAFAEDVKDAMDSGMNAHVSKPVDIGKLESTVKDILKKNRQAEGGEV